MGKKAQRRRQRRGERQRPQLPVIPVQRDVKVQPDGRIKVFFPPADPPPEYRAAARAALDEALAELGHDGTVLVGYCSDSSDAGIGYAGFFSDERPDVIWLVVERVPSERLREIVRHEAHHLVSFARGHKHDGHHDLAEEAAADAFAGRERGVWDREELLRESLARADEDPEQSGGPIEVRAGKITVTNPGGTVVIDGTSNIFKIMASNTLAVFGNAVADSISASVDLALGLGYITASWASACCRDPSPRRPSCPRRSTTRSGRHKVGGAPSRRPRGILRVMRHFATESGKSKGQFYTPAEVSRIIAKVVGMGTAARLVRPSMTRRADLDRCS